MGRGGGGVGEGRECIGLPFDGARTEQRGFHVYSGIVTRSPERKPIGPRAIRDRDYIPIDRNGF